MKVSPEYCDKCGVAGMFTFDTHAFGSLCYDCMETYHPDLLPE